jgi:signal transduction histidine kinase/ActR/RegA family two-component response regulator
MGCGQEEIAGRLILDVIGRDAYETILPHIEKVLSGEREEYEAQVNYPGVGLRWIHAVYVPTKGADHKVDGWIAVITDITDARRAQEEEFARQKLESIGTLANGIAHDFNNLLGGVLAQAELALEEYQAGSSPEEELKRIRDGAIRGSEIVRQLMIYAGRGSEAVGLVDVSQVAMGMIELLKVSISKHASVVTDFCPDLPTVRGSAGQIQQIVMNLVTNASEALEERDGVIRVATRRVNLDRAAAVSKGIGEGDYVQLEVTDTGHGMSWETQARVFDPFFTTKSQGRGLGLGVVRGIVRDLGGAIHLSSELGKGSTFQIFLRSTGIMIGASGPLPTATDSDPAPVATILVVEDDDALRVALAQILRRRSFETLDAANGTDAIKLLRANTIKIDMMLLDMTIPGPSSHDVAAVAAEARPGLKVVLTSAYDEKTVRTRVGAPQNCGFIRKPFQVEDLVQTLRNGLSLGTAAG